MGAGKLDRIGFVVWILKQRRRTCGLGQDGQRDGRMEQWNLMKLDRITLYLETHSYQPTVL